MIYILEDDNSIRELVVYSLKSSGMEVMGFERPSEFWEQIKKRNRRCFFWISCFRRKMA